MPVRSMWAPHPFRAGFAILDDTEGSSFESVRTVYDHFADAGLRATRTVWAFEADQRSGLAPLDRPAGRGVTLEDAAYRDYCAELVRRGCELALHGASAGNNPRWRTLAAFERLDALGALGRTFVPHRRNAENLYAQEPFIAASVLRPLMRTLRSAHRSFGQDPESPWYWGDVCRARVRWMRLFRTAPLDTLVTNPSLPYFERDKPLVRGWFATSERRLEDATTPEALAELVQAQGLCLLREHLGAYGDRWGVAPQLARSVRRLRSAPSLWVDTVEAVLDRRERMQAIALAWRDSNLWIVNTGDHPVAGLQLVFGSRSRPFGRNVEVGFQDGIATVRHVPARAIVYLDCATPIQVAGPNAVELDARHHGTWTFGHGSCRINLGHSPWSVGGVTVAPESFHLAFDPAAEPHRARMRAGDHERAWLFAVHLALLVRRVARQGGPPRDPWKFGSRAGHASMVDAR